MGFFEFVFIISLTVLLPLAIVKMRTDVRRQELEAQRASGDPQGGLTVGELKELLRKVVEEANEPIVARIEEIERQMLEPGAGASHDLLDESTATLDEAVERTVGRRVS
jgi:hypothetical protein